MKSALLVSLLFLPLSAFAQQSREPSPPAQHQPKDLEACRSDIHKYCEGVKLKQECLVAQWDHIADSCQNTLLIPMRGSGSGG